MTDAARFGALLLIPTLFGAAEFCDIQAARQMSTLAVMLSCRIVGLLILVPVLLFYGAPQFTTRGIGWCVANA